MARMLTLLSLSLASAAPLAPASLLAPAYPPAAEMIPIEAMGVTHAGEPAVYSGERLFDYIDGGAPQYLEYGFHEVATQELRYHGRTYIFDAYRMRDPLAAFGIFSVRRPPAAPALGRFAYSSLTPYQGLLAYGPYYIEIAAYEASDSTAQEMDFIAQLGTAVLDPSRAPRNLTETSLFRPFPPEGRVAGSEKVARGPISLRAGLAEAPAGVFREAIEALLERLPATHGAQAPRSAADSPERMRPPPLWQVIAYHPRADSTGAARATSLLVRLSDVEDPRELLRATAQATAEVPDRHDLPGGGWLAYDDARGHGFARLQGDRGLFLGVSHLPREEFAAWVSSLSIEPPQGVGD